MNYLIIFLKENKTKQINLLIDFLKGLIGASIKYEVNKELIVSYKKIEEIDFHEIANVINNELFINATILECETDDTNYLYELVKLYNDREEKSIQYLTQRELLLLSNNSETIKRNILKKYYNDNEMKNIIKIYLECDLNTTLASNKLYLHRNTLINKIDKFIKETGYDVRKFKDACIIYQLI